MYMYGRDCTLHHVLELAAASTLKYSYMYLLLGDFATVPADLTRSGLGTRCTCLAAVGFSLVPDLDPRTPRGLRVTRILGSWTVDTRKLVPHRSKVCRLVLE
jgi:hypothetical protein